MSSEVKDTVDSAEKSQDAPLLTLAHIRKDVIEGAEKRERARKSGRPVAPSTGFDKLDTLIGGGFMPGIHIMHGTPGTGKTALALCMATARENAAIYLSTEMRRTVIAHRLIARHFNVPMRDVYQYGPQDIGWCMTEICNVYPRFSIMECGAWDTSAPVLRRAMNTLRASYPDNTHGGVLLIVDSGHTWATSTYTDIPNEYEKLNTALNHLEMLSQATESPVLIIAERNRASQGESGQSSSKGTSRFEYAAETVIGLDVVNAPTVCVKVSKNRNGPLGELLLNFDGSTQTHTLADDNLPEEGQF